MKHEAQPMQACLQSVACHWAKCQLNEVKMKISLRQNYKEIKNEKLKISLRQRYKEIKNEKLKIKNEIQKITLYYPLEIPPPLGGRLGGGQKELRIKN